MTNTHGRVRIDTFLTAEDIRRGLREDARRGLGSAPKVLPPKYFYDARGSELFEDITRLPEYYLTRAERAILESRAAEIASLTSASTLVELGSGSSEKTHLLLSALQSEGSLRRYVPLDVSEGALRPAVETIAEDYPDLEVHGVVADFDRHMSHLAGNGTMLFAFLGSTIGNFDPAERRKFLSSVREGMRPGDALLLGTDLVKKPDRLVAAYDDAAGVTAEFNRNVLRVINRELDADFDPEAFAHVAVWDAEEDWIEMRLRARRAQRITVSAVDLSVDFTAGEEMLTEISAKFRRAGVEDELAQAGLRLAHWWTGDGGDFALSLSFA